MGKSTMKKSKCGKTDKMNVVGSENGVVRKLFSPKMLDDASKVSYKKVALGEGDRPDTVGVRIKRFGGMEPELSEIMSGLKVSEPPSNVKCCEDSDCFDCVMSELGKMVSNCIIEKRVKRIPSMISHIALKHKPSKYFKVRPNSYVEPPSSPEFGVLGKNLPKNPSKGSIKSFFFKKDVNGSNCGKIPAENKEKPRSRTPTPRSLCFGKSSKNPQNKPHFSGRKPAPPPPKKFGRKAAKPTPAPSSHKQGLMMDYCSTTLCPTNENAGS